MRNPVNIQAIQSTDSCDFSNIANREINAIKVLPHRKPEGKHFQYSAIPVRGWRHAVYFLPIFAAHGVYMKFTEGEAPVMSLPIHKMVGLS